VFKFHINYQIILRNGIVNEILTCLDKYNINKSLTVYINTNTNIISINVVNILIIFIPLFIKKNNFNQWLK